MTPRPDPWLRAAVGLLGILALISVGAVMYQSATVARLERNEAARVRLDRAVVEWRAAELDKFEGIIWGMGKLAKAVKAQKGKR